MKLRWKASETAVENAKRVLPGLVRAYYKSGRKLDEKSKPKELHTFRLKTKHLRYTLEGFVALFGTGLDARIDRLRPIQSALGDVNDCEVLLKAFHKKLPPAVRVHVQERASGKQAEFLRYWREEFDKSGEDKKWELYLTRPARAPRAKPSR